MGIKNYLSKQTKLLQGIVMVFALLASNTLFAQATFTSGVYTQDFGNTTDPGFPYSASGSWADNSYYPGWYIYENTGNYQGVVNITAAAPTNNGGSYMYTINGGTGLLLGTRPSDGAAGGSTSDNDGASGIALGLCLKNNTGATITSVNVQFDWYQLSEAEDGGQANSNWCDYLESAGIPSLTAGGFTNVPALNYVGPNVNGACCSAQISGLPGNVSSHLNSCITVTIPAGEYITLRWWDPNDVHNDPHFAIDNIQVTVATVSVSATSPTVCSGSPTTLNASGSCTTYTWTPSSSLNASTGSSVIATPTVSTTYTITGSLPGCGTATTTVAVAVNPSPTLTATPGVASVCSGGNTTLTASGAGASATYTWTPSASLSASTGTVVTATPTATTTYTLNGTSSAGCPAAATQTVSVTVNPTPTLSISGPATICSGGNTTLTASNASTYTWTPSSSLSASTGASVIASPTITTTYTVSGTSGAGCPASGTQTVVITVNPTNTITAAATPTVICSGNSTTLSSSGASTYTWQPGNLSGSTVSVSPGSSTTYSVTGIDGSGCTTATQTVAVTVNPTPTITVSATSGSVCSGNSDILNASGTSTYLWQPGNLTGSTISVSPGSSTTYTAVGTSAAGCPSAPQTIMILVNSTPTVTAVASPATICSGNSTTLTASNASFYTWQPGSISGSTLSVSPTVTSTYTVTGESVFGCFSAPVTVTVSVNPTPTVTAIATPATICSGDATTLTASNASTYTWQPGALTGSTVSVSPTVNTTYTVSGVSAAGCPAANTTVAITVNTTPTITASASASTICSGNSTTLSAGGASTYLWQPGGLTGSTVSVSPGISTTYTVVGTSVAGCASASFTVPVTVNITPTVSLSASPATICSDSSTVITASNASTYTWQPGGLTGSTVSVTPLSTTTYTVSGVSAAGCPGTNQTIIITVNPTPTITASANPANVCPGSPTTLTGSNASTYNWQPGNLSGSTVSVSPVVSTTYTVTGTSAASCPSSPVTVAVTVNPTPTITASASSPIICSGNADTLMAIGASTYSWQPGNLSGSTVSVSPLSTTTYTVTGTNALGCKGTPVTVIITVNTTPTVTAIASSPTICSDSATTLTGSGATTYLWQPGNLSGATVSVSPTTSTTYTLTGTSAAGCPSSSKTVTVNVNPTPTTTVAPISPVICPGGNVNLTATSTTGAGTTYIWAPAGTLSASTGRTVNANPASTTTYTVVANKTGCPGSPVTEVVTVATSLTVTVTPNPSTICNGDSIALNAGGASTFIWSPATGLSCTTCSNPNAAPSDTIVYKVVGSSGTCRDSINDTVNVNPTPTVSISITGTSSSICPGDSTGMLASGATTYIWSPVAGLSCTSCAATNAGPADTTIYTVTGSFATGCSSKASQQIIVFPKPVMTLNIHAATLCSGDSVTLKASGVTSYVWTPPTGLNTTTGPIVNAGPSTTTTYTVIGTGIGGCGTTDSVLIKVNTTPTVSIVPPNPTICSGESVSLTASGAPNYQWLPGSGLNCNTCGVVSAGPASSTTYTVVGTSAAGCKDTTQLTVTVNPTPTITISASNGTIICSVKDTTILTANGGGATYTWSPAAGLNSTTGASVSANPTVTTTYTVYSALASGCSSKDSIIIKVNPSPTVNVSAINPGLCSGNSTTINASGATSYTWSPNSGISATTGASVLVNPLTTTTYTIVGVGSGGCTDTNSIVITVSTTPTVTVNPGNVSICPGDSVIYKASGAISYLWSTGATTDSIIAKPTTTTTYTVTGGSVGCSATASVIVTVNTLTVTGTPVKSTLCNGDSTIINASGASTYTWFPATGLNVSTGNIVTAKPATTTTYTLAGVSVFGCSDTTHVIIKVNSLPIVKATSSVPSICSNGYSATLTATGASSYTWSPAIGLSPSTGTPVTATPATSETYTVTGTDGNGCMDTSSVTITVVAPPSIFIITNGGDSICKGASKILTASGATSYIWRTNPVQTTTSITVSPNTNTTYTVVGSNGTCSDSAEITIDQFPSFTAGIKNDTLCSGNTVSVSTSATGGSAPYSYLWSNGLGTNSTASILVSTGPTTYTCIVTDGCGTTDTATVVADGVTAPNAKFTTSADTVTGGQFISFINSNSGANGWFWALGDGYRANLDSAIYYQYTTPGTYIVTLWDSNRYGCMSSYSDTVYVIQNIFIPNVFTPNGDGQNDFFHVSVSGIQTYSIEIFNRWGEKIFNANSPYTDWDGTSNSGVRESDGTYYYIIHMTDYDNRPYLFKGAIQLLR